ncbi:MULTISPECIES: restriction endonuclease subunit S [unclassified Pseudomonas]|uniref:restriction endonuclease subunit S n=1 Tax=unclassified Pseudomonas TaxID=196821 RepID=UPI001430EAF1|nr:MULTISPECIES: restriction endonuclease subunit S [unclassified Pseudomonas]
MSEDVVSGWHSSNFGALCFRIVNGGTPETGNPAYWNGETPWITGADFTANGVGEFRRFVSEAGIRGSATSVVKQGNLLVVTRTGVGKLAIAPCDIAISQDISGVYINTDRAETSFVYYLLFRELDELKKLNQGTSINGIIRSDLEKHIVRFPVSKYIQRKIAEILRSMDAAIEKTEALIAKYQQVKAGLLHDLFNRGVLPNGQLRPPREQAPELYQETAIGWIPKEWELKDASMVLESVADGPFGSNLKTEHYVVDPGVRVVRLQNIVKHEYNDGDKAYISDRHAVFLVRNKVVGGDVLIAGLGEDRYPVGRACTYPAYLPPAVNKADCFRARCITGVMQNRFFMLFLNSELARRQIRRYEQGVTRPRINTGNLKRLVIGVPRINEQVTIIKRFEAAQAYIHRLQASVESLKARKLGLMQDLLTGKVPVKVDAPETADA